MTIYLCCYFESGEEARAQHPANSPEKKKKERNTAPLIVGTACMPTGKIQYPEVPPAQLPPTPGYCRMHRSLMSHSQDGGDREAHMSGLEPL
jgi:hypothetical protein